jgi:hypothetical protein
MVRVHGGTIIFKEEFDSDIRKRRRLRLEWGGSVLGIVLFAAWMCDPVSPGVEP